jgi:hypothetical protein
MADLSYKNDSKQDERLNPADKPNSAELQQQEQAGYDREFNDMVNNSNLSDLKDLEGDDEGFYRRRSAYGGTANSRGATRYMSRENIQAIVKKRGVLGLLATVLVGGGLAGFMLFSPGMAIVQMKEALTKDLNDQLTAMDRRSVHVFASKLKSLQAGGSICSGTVNIRCKFSSMSGTSVKNFEKAGIALECGEGVKCNTGALSRNQVSKITFPDGSSFTNPAEATRHARTNTQAAAAMRRAYNPLYRGFSDGPAGRAFAKLRVSKQNILTSGDAEENNERVRDAVKNGVDTDGRLAIDTPDDDENKANREKAGQLSSDLAEGASQVEESGVKAASGALSGVTKSLGILGIADNACTIYRTGLAVEAGAKTLRAEQLARFAMAVALVPADSIKAGDATPEQVEYVGNLLTATDDRKEITVTDSAGKQHTEPNPMYNKSAFDSDGYKIAQYNDAPILSGAAQQYTVGGSGGLLSALSAANASIETILGNNPRDTCKVVQNGFVRVGSLIVGVAVGALSGGSSIVLNLAANTAFSIAMGYAEQMLIDLVAGTAVDKNTTGAQAGNAIFAGTAVVMSRVAATRGLSPLTKSQVKGYTTAKAETDSLNVAIDKYEAEQDPYDISNQYTFVGSLARNLNTVAIASHGNVLSTLGSLAASPLKLATANATTSLFNSERYERCDDPTYEQLDLAADVFCNLRYGLSDTEMSMDTGATLDYMIANGHIDEATGEPKSELFKNYVLYCTDRTNPIGNSADNEAGDDMSDGKLCFSQSLEYQNFRVYLVDKSISEGIDEEQPVAAAASPTPTTNSGNVNAEGWSYPTDTDATVTQPFIPGAHTGQDIAKNGDVPIFAVRDGIVTGAGDISNNPPYIQPCTNDKSPSVQQVVTIKHVVGSETYFSSYHHVAAGSINVKIGSTVKAGDKIAMMGSTGCSFGQHLHFEIWKNSIFGGGINVDPATVLKR